MQYSAFQHGKFITQLGIVFGSIGVQIETVCILQNRHTHTQTYAYTHTLHSHTHTYIHAHKHTHTNTHTRTRAHARTDVCIHTSTPPHPPKKTSKLNYYK